MKFYFFATYDPPMPYNQIPKHLRRDKVHRWRAKKGIELIHKEPTYAEFKRICENWDLMNDQQKALSDKMSMKLYGMTNKEHMKVLEKEYNK